MIRNPLNPYPSNQKIFLSQQQKLEFDFIFSGDVLRSYYIYAQWRFMYGGVENIAQGYFAPDGNYYISTTSASTPPSWSPLNFPTAQFSTYPDCLNLTTSVFNGEKEMLTCAFDSQDWETIESMSLQGNSFNWCIVMSAENSVDDPAVVVCPDAFVTNVYSFNIVYPLYIYSRSSGDSNYINKIRLNQSSDENISNSTVTIGNYQSSIVELDAYIFQDLKCYQVFLYDEDNHLIDQTEKIFSGHLHYKYYTLLSGKSYAAKFVLYSQENLSMLLSVNIQVVYEENHQIDYPPTLTVNPQETSVNIHWIKDKSAVGKYSGGLLPSFEPSGSETFAIIPEGQTLIYDNISSMPIEMNKNLFTIGIRQKSPTDRSQKIFDLYIEDVIYRVELKDYYFYINGKNTQVCTKGNLAWMMQESDSPTTNTGYVITDSNEDEIGENTYIVVSDETNPEDYYIILNRNGTSFNWYIGKVGSAPTIGDGSILERMYANATGKNQIILYGNQEIDTLIFDNSGVPVYSSSSFQQGWYKFVYNTNDTGNDPATNDIGWADFSNYDLQILCLFNGTISSSYLSGIGGIISYCEIIRKDDKEIYPELVAFLDSEQLDNIVTPENDEIYSLTDYNVKNNAKYTYTIRLVTSENNRIEAFLTNEITTEWDIFSLIPIIPQTDSEEGNSFSVVRDENGEPIIWSFQLNLEEGDISLAQDKTYFDNFSPYPKLSVGEMNYHKGSFSCLLGNTFYNCRYFEPLALLNKWIKMLKQDYLYLLKNAKGESFIVSIDPESSRAYMNEVANYYVEDQNGVYDITNRPATISFNYTEIMSASDVQIWG